MIGSVMFLGGFFMSLLAFYGRNAPLLMLAGILFAFCWVGNERVHKAFRFIPLVFCFALGVISFNCGSNYAMGYDYYNYTAIICAILSVLLLVSMPKTTKQ